MQTDETTLEKAACGHLSPTIIVCIADYESRQDKEKVHCNVTMVQCRNQSATDSVSSFSERQSFKDVIYDYQQGRNSTQTVQ